MNKMMKRTWIALTLFLGINAHILADTNLPGQCEAALPKILNQNLISEADVQKLMSSGDWGQSAKVDRYWTVYSDRENNVTYKEPNKTSGRFEQLKFNQELRIAKISGDFALVYEDQMKNAAYPKINQGRSYGWIPMENLLLWSSCPTDSIGIYNKALPVMNIDEFLKDKTDAGMVFTNPEQKSEPKQLLTSTIFYFVMKEDKKSGMKLLSTECNLTGGYTERVLYGWVRPVSFIKWNQRACLEPNWNPEAAESMANKNVKKVDVYRQKNLTDRACEMPLGRTNNLGNQSNKYRMYPDEMRYPLLDNEKNMKLYRVTAFATPDGKAHIAKVRDNKDRSVRDEQNKALEEASKINLIIVIDGTSSMEDFYNPVQQIIQKANDHFSTEKKNEVRVGVVIYRDYPDGEGLTEYLPMTKPQDANLAKFLSKGGKYGIRSVAKTATEALYKGLEVALDASKMGYKANQSNLMFVIGDCGNAQGDKNCLDSIEIINRCAANRVQLSAFQVYNGTSQAYKSFRRQMGAIIRGNLHIQYNLKELKKTKDGEKFQWKWKELPNGYEFKTNLIDDVYYIGNMRNAKNGEKMPLNELYDIVTDSYHQFNEVVENRKGRLGGDLREIVMYADSSVSDRTAAAQVQLDFIQRVFDKATIDKVKSANMLMAFTGWAQQVDAKSGYDFWNTVVYISAPEFNDMMEKLQPVMAAAEKSSTDRMPYINALKALVRLMVPDIEEKQMAEMSTGQIMGMVAGLPAKARALQGRSLKDIQDSQAVPQEEFDGLIAKFKNKYRKLYKIKDDKYDFSIVRNGVRWYWLPVEDLP